MKFGIIFSAYNTIDYVAHSLAAWMMARQKKLNGHEFYICAVNVKFAQFENDKEDGTREILQYYLDSGLIDNLITGPDNIPETTARSMALQDCIKKKCDYIWQYDSDEFISKEQIANIIEFVEENKFIDWFRLSYRNYVFDDKSFLEEPFTPPRIHKTKTTMDAFVAERFWDDNNIEFGGKDWTMKDIELPGIIVPKSVAWIKHLTWLNNERSRKKVEYQMQRWGHCSFKWTESGLAFDEEYFKKIGQSIPKLLRESS